MKFAAIVLNYRTPDMTIDAVDATIKALLDVDFSWSITVVDNDSGDGSEEKLRAACTQRQQAQMPGWDSVEILQSGHNGGFGAGNNVGIRHVMMRYEDLEYIYILNSDAFPEKDALQHLVDFLDKNTSYGVVGSYIFGEDGAPHISTFRFPNVLGELEGAIKLGPITRLLKKYVVPIISHDQSRDVDWLAGASMLMRVDMIHQVGLFDEAFFLYFEETDLLLRAQQQGWKTRYLLESKVKHIGSVSTGMKTWERIPGYWLDSRRHYFIKHHGRVYFYATTLLKVLGHELWRLRRLLTHKPDTEPKNFSCDLLQHCFQKRD